ncbi:MAG: DUF5106 domain-containing protein [Bacteroidales bacterium]|nr:DUF5106 domain-containing protein [Bacteroidales bacterium]
MKKTLVLMMALAGLAVTASAQSYKITLIPQKAKCEKYYMGQHFRDKFNIVDSATLTNGQIVFEGKKIADGIYALLNSDKKKMFDFTIDDSRKYSINFDTNCSNKGMVVKGSKSCQLMYEYMAKMDYGRSRSREINNLRKTDTAQARKQMEKLSKEMETYIADYQQNNSKYLFARLVKMFDNIAVPDTIPADSKMTNLGEWQSIYYRTHYWDNVDFSDHELIYTPQMFDKMNYYFYGVLYYQDCDTITRYADMILHRLEKDSTWLRYFLEYITPKYERATKNVGWDQVFVNLVNTYYLQGKCPWATEAEIYSKRNTVAYLSHSLIGAVGQEILMPDSNQTSDANQWISSHRFPQRYVIIWIWDPDCHHCQEQSEALKILYDSLAADGFKPFEVYAIGYEADVKKWKNYIRTHKFPFVNVGGSNVNIDYQEAYNVHGAPTMILLDPDRRIIMNKTLPAKSILDFIDRYEQEHPEVVTKVTPWMMAGGYNQEFAAKEQAWRAKNAQLKKQKEEEKAKADAEQEKSSKKKSKKH